MEKATGRRYFLLWLFAAALAMAAAVIQYVRTGEVNIMGAILGLICVAMAILSYSRSRAADPTSAADR